MSGPTENCLLKLLVWYSSINLRVSIKVVVTVVLLYWWCNSICVDVAGPTSVRRLNNSPPPGLGKRSLQRVAVAVWPSTTTGLGEQKHWREKIFVKRYPGENRELTASLHKSCPRWVRQRWCFYLKGLKQIKCIETLRVHHTSTNNIITLHHHHHPPIKMLAYQVPWWGAV